jgi:hypothetical protein
MQHVKSLELSIFYLIYHFVSLVVQLDPYRQHHVAVRKNRAEFEHMRLIVNNLTLDFGALNRLELSAADCVSSTNNESFLHVAASCSNYLVSYFDHGLVKCFRITSYFEFAVFVHVGKSRQHICAWNSYLVKHHPAIVLLMIT